MYFYKAAFLHSCRFNKTKMNMHLRIILLFFIVSGLTTCKKEVLEPTIIVQDSLGRIESTISSTLSSHNTSTRKKPKKNKTSRAGNSITKKFPVVILSGLKSERYFLIKLTLMA